MRAARGLACLFGFGVRQVEILCYGMYDVRVLGVREVAGEFQVELPRVLWSTRWAGETGSLARHPGHERGLLSGFSPHRRGAASQIHAFDGVHDFLS